MKILVAVDQNPYSSYAVSEVAKFAANTWANISLLGVQAKRSPKNYTANTGEGLLKAGGAMAGTLIELRQRFLSHFNQDECPYGQSGFNPELSELRKGVFEALSPSMDARKKLRLRMRIGSTAKEILSEAREEESDLIVIGCDQENGCGWQSGASLPRKIANDAPCSVLVVKKKKEVKRIICCLDHDRVSQPSLEMINQMVTLHDARLTIIGFAGHQNLDSEVEKKMDKVLRYYHARGIDPWVEMVELASLESFVAKESRWGLMALWMGPHSILEKAFPRSKVNKLIKGGDASVLILR